MMMAVSIVIGGGGDEKVVAKGYDDDGCEILLVVVEPSTSKHDNVDKKVVEIKKPNRSSTTISLAAQ
ncbi:hypothetical protein DVH24_006255 [Malus domestica]|uniref:Uncharacterized protein n=1 Tax=Malus domestica TaxID=3750 RepID=A0A498KBV0_MALDO|nr:hypothetical protein DVH24_006255 [Malus domestica]